ncbi:MAG: response regulator [Proteobacteria bacterium]|nr:response regulator [Pseudomonadota bacterium]
MERILVVDDDNLIRRNLRSNLQDAGYDVEEAPNGKWAIEIHRQNPVDIIITDIVMPEKGGIQMLSELRQEFPDLKIIVMSGGGLLPPQDHLDVAQSFGAVKTFVKPVSFKSILDAVRELSGADPNDPHKQS